MFKHLQYYSGRTKADGDGITPLIPVLRRQRRFKASLVNRTSTRIDKATEIDTAF